MNPTTRAKNFLLYGAATSLIPGLLTLALIVAVNKGWHFEGHGLHLVIKGTLMSSFYAFLAICISAGVLAGLAKLRKNPEQNLFIGIGIYLSLCLGHLYYIGSAWALQTYWILAVGQASVLALILSKKFSKNRKNTQFV